jgi:hypothetical protein
MVASGAAYNKASSACIEGNDLLYPSFARVSARSGNPRSGDDLSPIWSRWTGACSARAGTDPVAAAGCHASNHRPLLQPLRRNDSLPSLSKAVLPDGAPRLSPASRFPRVNVSCRMRGRCARFRAFGGALDRRVRSRSRPSQARRRRMAYPNGHVAFCRRLYQRCPGFFSFCGTSVSPSHRSTNVRFFDRAPENGRWPSAHQ